MPRYTVYASWRSGGPRPEYRGGEHEDEGLSGPAPDGTFMEYPIAGDLPPHRCRLCGGAALTPQRLSGSGSRNLMNNDTGVGGAADVNRMGANNSRAIRVLRRGCAADSAILFGYTSCLSIMTRQTRRSEEVLTLSSSNYLEVDHYLWICRVVKGAYLRAKDKTIGATGPGRRPSPDSPDRSAARRPVRRSRRRLGSISASGIAYAPPYALFAHPSALALY
ncbi:hypothetical protein EVAR_61958_1 [Eumeta japonica]|uniref:Uncharacterized protein n=1 Tax=Eumeta variegata TaxID=151549 RepID=A0A4C1ZKR5_EUMVA|nr:hypothetical protein EVAR_61958_1 [Eumeta japonica]